MPHTQHTLVRTAQVAALAALTAGVVAPLTVSAAQAKELNLYSSRHYDTDERLYSDFEKKTGIKINRIEDKALALIKRIKAEGANSPADVLLTVDAGRLWAADRDGLFQPMESAVIDKAVPANLRHPNGQWVGFTQRARVIFYSKSRVSEPPKTYEELADPKFKGKICTRSGSNIYMLSLLSSVIDRVGEDGAKKWAAGLWANRAREPQGGDTDQLRAVASGECDIVIANTYYFARALRKQVRDLSGKTDDIGIVFPNQDGVGTHVNISGGGIVKTAPNAENAKLFLEYLVSESAQEYLAAGNDEYPVVEGIARSSSVQSLGEFKADSISLTKYGENQPTAQKIYDEVGYR
ncbi:MAG: Fe(3+) ABC transporter substrate-binding protein [Pseudomonadota bacterium]